MGMIRLLLIAGTHLEFETQGPSADKLQCWTFHVLPARPMTRIQMHAAEINGRQIKDWIQSRLFEIPEDSVMQIKAHGNLSEETLRILSAPFLRALAPATMNINAVLSD
ncbi:MAG: hypothetical protein P8X68_13960 [Desulfobacterales bacterium]|jgi:hypothetical protein